MPSTFRRLEYCGLVVEADEPTHDDHDTVRFRLLWKVRHLRDGPTSQQTATIPRQSTVLTVRRGQIRAAAGTAARQGLAVLQEMATPKHYNPNGGKSLFSETGLAVMSGLFDLTEKSSRGSARPGTFRLDD